MVTNERRRRRNSAGLERERKAIVLSQFRAGVVRLDEAGSYQEQAENRRPFTWQVSRDWHVVEFGRLRGSISLPARCTYEPS